MRRDSKTNVVDSESFAQEETLMYYKTLTYVKNCADGNAFFLNPSYYSTTRFGYRLPYPEDSISTYVEILMSSNKRGFRQ